MTTSITTTKSHYEVLGVQSSATLNEIKVAYHQLARLYHPDRQQKVQNQQQEQQQQEEPLQISPQLQQQPSQQQPSPISDTLSTVGGSSTTTTTQSSSSLSSSTQSFKRIQIAWECLRNDETRTAYNQNLEYQQIMKYRQHQKSIPLTLKDDFHEAIDEETNEILYYYECRCGDEIHISESDSDNNDWIPIIIMDKNNNNNNNDNNNINVERETETEKLLVECPGCCFVYRVQR